MGAKRRVAFECTRGRLRTESKQLSMWQVLMKRSELNDGTSLVRLSKPILAHSDLRGVADNRGYDYGVWLPWGSRSFREQQDEDTKM